MSSQVPGQSETTTGHERGTLVLFAFACDPHQGSEPGAGWAALSTASRLFAKIILVTRDDRSPRVVDAARGLPADIEVVALTTPFDRGSPLHLRYAAWVIRAARWVVRRLRRDPSIRVLHHVTYASDWMFSPLALLSNRSKGEARAIWGPVGGATYPRDQVLRLFPARFRLHEWFRRASTSTARMLSLPLHRRVVDVAIAMNPDTARTLRGFPRIDISANIALDGTPSPVAREARENVIVFAGRPLEWKGVRLILAAHALSRGNWKLELYGGTPAEFAEFGDVSRPGITVAGRIPRDDLMRRLGQVRCLALPSLHDSAGWIAAEAAAVGTQVVCLDLGGVSTMAGDHAVIVEAQPAASLVQRLARSFDDAMESDRPGPVVRPAHWTTAAYEKKLRDWYWPS